MTPNYQTYTTYGLDSSGNVTQTVVVDGTASDTFCYYPCGYRGQQTCYLPSCANATHTPSIKNVMGTSGGTTVGPTTGAFNHILFQTTTTLNMQNQHDATADVEASVFCSAAQGLLLSVISLPKLRFGVDFIPYGDPVLFNPLQGTCTWQMADPDCRSVARCVQDEIISACHDQDLDSFLSVTKGIPWLEVQTGNTVKGACFNGSVLEQTRSEFVTAGTCSAVPSHLGVW
jgi:hypothetical protein